MAILDELKQLFDQKGIGYTLVGDRVDVKFGDRLKKNQTGTTCESLRGVLTSDSIMSFSEMNEGDFPDYLCFTVVSDFKVLVNQFLLESINDQTNSQFNIVNGKLTANSIIYGRKLVSDFDIYFEALLSGTCCELCAARNVLIFTIGMSFSSMSVN